MRPVVRIILTVPLLGRTVGVWNGRPLLWQPGVHPQAVRASIIHMGIRRIHLRKYAGHRLTRSGLGEGVLIRWPHVAAGTTFYGVRRAGGKLPFPNRW